MKNKKLYLLILGIVILLGVATGGIIAWLTDTDTTNSKTFTVGEVSYVWTEGTLEDDFIVPGQEIIETSYKLKNTSNVSSELRVKITITYGDPEVDAIDLFDNFALANDWDKDGDYYYYKPNGNEKIEPEETPTDFDVLDSLILDGSKVGNDFRNVEFTITLKFEAKQAEFVTWEQLGTANIDFGTGLEQTP
ncbi:MAG: hypothetical protein WC907_01155 [Acholeplasmataceae bacterium]